MYRLPTLVLFAAALVFPSTGSGQTRISAGETASGALTSRDHRMDNGGHFDLWTYSGIRGETIIVTIRSIHFDAFAILQRYPGGSSPVLARDDDGGSGIDARIEHTLPETGEYLITVTTTERGETGAYRIGVRSDRPKTRAPVQTAAAIPAPTPLTNADKPASESKAAAPVALTLSPGETVSGTLSSNVRGAVGAGESDWKYTGRAGETITLDLRSSEFDPHLTLYSLTGRTATRVAQDDDGGTGLDARIVYRLPSDGQYVARAERRQAGRSGSYTLSLRSNAGLLRRQVRSPAERLLSAGVAATSELDNSDAKMRDGTPYELWRYVGRAGEFVRVVLRSDDFDAFVSIGTVTNGVFTAIESADDGAGGTDSRLELTLPFAGEFVIRTNSLSPRRPNGDYLLRIDSFR